MTKRTDEGGGAADAAAEGRPREEFLALFRRGLRFTEEILAENERLRYRLANLEAELDARRLQTASVGEAAQLVASLRQKIADLETERVRLMSSYTEVENLNRDYQVRYAEIEEEHNNLANLYIASYQLHATLSFRDVVQVVSEIVINLVGVSRFTMYLHDMPSGTLHGLATEGHPLDDVAPVPLGQGTIGKAAADKARVLSDDGKAPLAVIPLATVETLVGVIVIDQLLVQKGAFTPVDHELFTLLGVHAATSLLSALIREHVGEEATKEALSIARARALLA
jgi:hypothetical protein